MVKQLLESVDTMYDFRRSGLYKHMKFRNVDNSRLDTVKVKLMEGFRDGQKFDYMTGYEPWEKLLN